jgi:Lysylphosphatidylglycerol synthase TM region
VAEARNPAGRSRSPAWRRILPWLVSAGALGYVFGWVVDWRSLPQASERADLPLFIAICVFDKIVFFFFWGWIQARVIQRLVEPISTRQLLQVKGASEILRIVSNPLGDAGFFFGVAQLVRGRLAAIAAVAVIPFVCHAIVLLLQVTVALLLLEGGVARNRDVAAAVAVGWGVLVGFAIVARFGLARRFATSDWLAWMRPRNLAPFLPWFFVLAAADVAIQGLATRAFGVPIGWAALAGRIPILYAALSIPSLGNFGTREIAWAQLFDDYASRETLVAYSLWTNVIFLAMNAAIGALFLPHALALVREMRRARRAGEPLPQPLLHDPADP